MDTSGRTVRDLHNLATVARILLYVQAGLAALAVIISLTFGTGIPEEIGPYDLIALLQFFAFIAGGFAVLRWIYLANANARAFGAQGMSTSPAMAVGSYFIPIACLFLPFQSMREIWKASTQPRDWEAVRAPAVIGWWWLFWIVSNILGFVGLRLDMDAGLSNDTGRASELLTTVSDLLTIPASLLLATIIAEISEKQRAATPAAIFS